MEAFMAGAAVTEIFLGSVILAVVMSVWAMRGMFWLMEGAGRGIAGAAKRPFAVRTGMANGSMVLAPIRASRAR
jgi:hypothetical protein